MNLPRALVYRIPSQPITIAAISNIAAAVVIGACERGAPSQSSREPPKKKRERK